eukprot:1532531-Alexandrium_andersonii.AAC.1
MPGSPGRYGVARVCTEQCTVAQGNTGKRTAIRGSARQDGVSEGTRYCAVARGSTRGRAVVRQGNGVALGSTG